MRWSGKGESADFRGWTNYFATIKWKNKTEKVLKKLKTIKDF